MSAEKKADKPGHHKTLSGSKPIQIGGSGVKPDPKAGYRTKDGMILAASAPVISMQPPPPPSARPRIPSVEPPPMELPPSPPVFSPMQAEVAQQQAQAQKVQFAAGTTTTAKAKPALVYSRSLSNYSSSAPAGHLDFLANFQPKLGSEEAVKEEDDEDDDTITNTIGGAGSTAAPTTTAAQKRLSAVRNEALSLSKSPTVFSILTQGLLEHPGPNVPASTSTASVPSSHVRGIVEVPSASSTAASSKESKGNDEIASAEGGDDLQFSISLDDNEAAGGGDEDQSEQQESGYF